MEQAEGDEQAEARPHPCGASSLPQSAEQREEGGGDSVGGGKRGQKEEITLEIWTATQHTQVIGLYKRSKKGYHFYKSSYPATPLPQSSLLEVPKSVLVLFLYKFMLMNT